MWCKMCSTGRRIAFLAPAVALVLVLEIRLIDCPENEGSVVIVLICVSIQMTSGAEYMSLH